MAALVDETVDLLQHLIRNACVNDGSAGSGHEHRTVDVLRSVLEGPRVDVGTYAPVEGRESLVGRIEGSDPDAPSLLFMGHTDVVPANPDRWTHDPYGGELHDGFVWGRGAIDMLNLTASMAVAFRELARSGFAPRGTLVYLAVADEEAGGGLGAEWLVEEHPDAVRTDYVVTELGGARLGLDGAPRVTLAVGEKGAIWGRITVRGTPGHGSMPLRTDNALVTGAEVVRRLAAWSPPPRITDVWRRFVDGIDLPADLAAALTDPGTIDGVLADLPDLGMARFAHACTHATLAPTVMDAGVKNNVIPDTATVGFDLRALPGDTEEDVREMLAEALGELADRCEIDIFQSSVATASPLETPLWDLLQRHAERLVPGARNVPYLIPGGTDSRFLRRLGAVCYGYGLFSDRVPFGELTRMFHGDDERVDVESLRLTTELWLALARDLLEG